jgi:hypothetical protein
MKGIRYFDANIVGVRFVPANAGAVLLCAQTENIFTLLFAFVVNYLNTHTHSAKYIYARAI